MKGQKYQIFVWVNPSFIFLYENEGLKKGFIMGTTLKFHILPLNLKADLQTT